MSYKRQELNKEEKVHEESTEACEGGEDVFERQIKNYDASKTLKTLNFIYSMIVGVLTSSLSKNYTKYNRLIGILVSLLSYLINRKFIKIEDF